MGATPLLELYGFNAEVQRVLAERGVPVARTLVGNYVTSLDMAGCSVTLCQVDEELLRLWDAPVQTAGLRWGTLSRPGRTAHGPRQRAGHVPDQARRSSARRRLLPPLDDGDRRVRGP